MAPAAVTLPTKPWQPADVVRCTASDVAGSVVEQVRPPNQAPPPGAEAMALIEVPYVSSEKLSVWFGSAAVCALNDALARITVETRAKRRRRSTRGFIADPDQASSR